MDRILEFTVFCLESYKQEHHVPGKSVLKVFNDNKVFDYIVKDIDVYINSRQN